MEQLQNLSTFEHTLFSMKKWILLLVTSPLFLADGHRIVYDREVPFELRIQDSNTGPQEVGTLEAIKVKILVLGEDQNPEQI